MKKRKGVKKKASSEKGGKEVTLVRIRRERRRQLGHGLEATGKGGLKMYRWINTPVLPLRKEGSKGSATT